MGVTLVLLVRHGLTAVTGAVLTGRMPGMASTTGAGSRRGPWAARLAGVDLDAIVTSTLDRCQETAAAIAAARDGNQLAVQADERFAEVGYGDWTGQPLKRLAKEPLWRVVQAHPSAVRFPGRRGVPGRGAGARRRGGQGLERAVLARRRSTWSARTAT